MAITPSIIPSFLYLLPLFFFSAISTRNIIPHTHSRFFLPHPHFFHFGFGDIPNSNLNLFPTQQTPAYNNNPFSDNSNINTNTNVNTNVGSDDESEDNSDDSDTGKGKYEVDFKGSWELFKENCGVNAMHMILLPNNKVVLYDATVFGPTKVPLGPKLGCWHDVDSGKDDCSAHAVELDIERADYRPLKVTSNTWCSSGSLALDGSLVSTGGYQKGTRVVRYLGLCEDCQWREDIDAMADARWYATQVTMPDGKFIVIGGRGSMSYEYVPDEGKYNKAAIPSPFMKETTEVDEMNLYPFVHLSTDGNLFIFANTKSILFDPSSNQVVREFPVLAGGARNYPASGMSALLPLKLKRNNPDLIPAEVMVCGGAWPRAYQLAVPNVPDEKNKVYLPALQDCARLIITEENPTWQKETMPSPRVMGDMLNLPTGDLLMINGARKGTSAWYAADDPNYTPVLYKPMEPIGRRFVELNPSNIPRMYHSTSAVLPDGKILVGGSNTNDGYKFVGVKYPTELRIEKFSPPYTSPELDQHRPEIIPESSQTKISYGNEFSIQFKLEEEVGKKDVKVTMYAPAFTTHGVSMNQRLIFLANADLKSQGGVYEMTVIAPPSGKVAPPGYYLLFVVNRGVPGKAIWVQIK